MTDLIKSIISLVVAIIPLLILVVALISNRTEKTTDQLDSSSLKVLTIIRYPLEEVDWKKIKSNYLFGRTLINILCVLLYFSLGFYNLFYLKSYILLTINVLIFIIFVLISRLYFMPHFFITLYFQTSATGARYFIYKNALILIQSNYRYLFDKSINILKRMKFMIIEINEREGYLEGCQIRSIGKPTQLKVKIEKVSNLDSSYRVKIEYVSSLSLLKNSRITNRFINLLISKPKNTDEKTATKVDVPTNVEN